MPARLIHKADFDSLMSAPVWSRSAHFAVHHLARGPKAARRAPAEVGGGELSTGVEVIPDESVDKGLRAIWAGAVVPKRQARHAVTRNLLKRQIRQAFSRHEAKLAHGLWVVRLRRGFEKTEFASARSRQLAEAARIELDELLQRGPGSPRQRATAGPPHAAAAR